MKYHRLDRPFFPNPYPEDTGLSALQDLYPGRPMSRFDGYDSYDIPPENPEGAKKTFELKRLQTVINAQDGLIHAMEAGKGDKEKVLIHAVDEPDVFANDPNLQTTSINPLQNNNGFGMENKPTIEHFTSTGDVEDCPNNEYIRKFIICTILLLVIMLLLGILG